MAQSNPVPLPTFVPQDAWLTLTLGQIEVSVAVTVPNITYLSPSVINNTTIDGLVGPADGAIVYLAGTMTKLDGGQRFMMWDATSLVVADKITVFCPFSDTSIPGRWKTTEKTTNIGLGGVIVTSGSVVAVAPSTVAIYTVIVRKTVGGVIQLNMPSSPLIWQEFVVKDGKGDASINPITINMAVNGNTVDGAGYVVIANDYGSMRFKWNGTEYNQI